MTKYFKIGLVAAIVMVVVGIIVALVVMRQQAQARYIQKSREADSLAFVAEILQKQVEAIVGLGEYKQDTLWLPSDSVWLPQDSVWLPADPALVPVSTPTVSFDTTADFEWAGWAMGIKAEGKFYCDSTYSDSNSLKLYPAYWRRPPPLMPGVMDVNIDPGAMPNLGLGLVAVNKSVGLSVRFRRTTIIGMRDFSGSWGVGLNAEILRLF